MWLVWENNYLWMKTPMIPQQTFKHTSPLIVWLYLFKLYVFDNVTYILKWPITKDMYIIRQNNSRPWNKNFNIKTGQREVIFQLDKAPWPVSYSPYFVTWCCHIFNHHYWHLSNNLHVVFPMPEKHQRTGEPLPSRI